MFGVSEASHTPAPAVAEMWKKCGPLGGLGFSKDEKGEILGAGYENP